MASLCRLTYALRRLHCTFPPACFSILNTSSSFPAQNSATPTLSPPLQSYFTSCTSANTNPSWKNKNIRGYGIAVAAQTPIKVGDRLPEATLSYFDKEGNLQTVSTSGLATGKKIVLFAVPGAFTPTCSQKHVPGFVEKSDQLRAKGVDLIACVSVNDAFVLKAWSESIGVDGDKLLVLSDGNRHFTDAMGVAVDLSDKPVGLGVRSRRYSLLAEDGVVKVLHLEEGGSYTISGADDILKAL
ncbi:hypothetical protein SUGI_0002800 [Cryptomeria japonica]|uniref:peroxiredoxin-2E-1, chloroplastic n=1 Tax=Cryptomeria japonica TaxID=3369 RepID=UPI002408DFC8|nr:peroxiredoxin-2E-1, chloroplastic [Cryptomeria japonica]GLJ04760.1 hypothetical protein SUGI_0002800 [Cryptomeria japonica]